MMTLCDIYHRSILNRDASIEVWGTFIVRGLDHFCRSNVGTRHIFSSFLNGKRHVMKTCESDWTVTQRQYLLIEKPVKPTAPIQKSANAPVTMIGE